MNQPRVYMCPPSRNPLPPPSPSYPLGCPSALALGALFPASNLDWSSVSHMVIYMFHCYSLKSSHPSRLLQAWFEFPESHRKFPLAICFTHGIVNFYVTLSIHLPFSLLSSHLVRISVLYVYFSITALKINSSVPSLQIPYICVSI